MAVSNKRTLKVYRVYSKRLQPTTYNIIILTLQSVLQCLTMTAWLHLEFCKSELKHLLAMELCKLHGSLK